MPDAPQNDALEGCYVDALLIGALWRAGVAGVGWLGGRVLASRAAAASTMALSSVGARGLATQFLRGGPFDLTVHVGGKLMRVRGEVFRLSNGTVEVAVREYGQLVYQAGVNSTVSQIGKFVGTNVWKDVLAAMSRIPANKLVLRLGGRNLFPKGLSPEMCALLAGVAVAEPILL